jgi:hypothetical protein
MERILVRWRAHRFTLARVPHRALVREDLRRGSFGDRGGIGSGCASRRRLRNV